MLDRLSDAVAALAQKSPFTNVYGLARSLIATSTLVTLACTPLSVLFHFRPTDQIAPSCGFSALQRMSLFCSVPTEYFELLRWACIFVLLVAISGWRPRYTGVLHWWIAFSYQSTATFIEGGDQIAAIVTLLLVPVTMADGRKWHWSAPLETESIYHRVFALMPMSLIKLQAAGIYLHAAAGKFGQEQWANGTAMYYWVMEPSIGATPMMLAILRPLITSPAVAVLTWGVVALEFFLAAGLVATPKMKRLLLFLGVALHLGIVIIFGLISFSVTMFGVLLLFLGDLQKPLRLPAMSFDRAIYSDWWLRRGQVRR